MVTYFKRLYSAFKEKSFTAFLYHILIYFYWEIKSTQMFEINGYSATFDADIDRGGARNRRRFPREKEEIKYLIEQIKPTDVVYDIGANIGLFTCFLSQQVPQGEVIAFEPYPPNVEQLRRNVSYNEGNARIFEIALSDRHGTINFDQPPDEKVGYGTASITSGNESSDIAVKTAPADDLTNQGKIPQPNVVKLDVEGSESLVVSGMEETLSSDACRVLLCEIHLKAGNSRPSIYDFGTTPKEFYTQIEDLGFEIESQNRRQDAVHIRAIKKNE